MGEGGADGSGRRQADLDVPAEPLREATVGGEERRGLAHRQGDIEAVVNRVVAAEREVEGLVPQGSERDQVGEQAGGAVCATRASTAPIAPIRTLRHKALATSASRSSGATTGITPTMPRTTPLSGSSTASFTAAEASSTRVNGCRGLRG